MKKNIYNKLVRDKIPDIIEEHGDRAKTHIATADEYWPALLAKLEEEVREFVASDGSLEELADILEVIEALCEYRGIELDEARRVQQEKRQNRGGFSRRIILEATQ